MKNNLSQVAKSNERNNLELVCRQVFVRSWPKSNVLHAKIRQIRFLLITEKRGALIKAIGLCSARVLNWTKSTVLYLMSQIIQFDY